MSKQFWVGDFYVDLSRNQISQQGQSHTLPPKALMVLAYLAEHKGRVVSYDELLDNVWPDTVVTANSLQRSVAQLRKVLGESSKSQNIIKTHAKQGYSLECNVSWDELNKPLVPQETKKRTNTSKYPTAVPRAIFVGIMIIAVIAAKFLTPSPTPHWEFSDLRYITATDDKEFGATYSLNGEYILFHRYYDKVCFNDLWAKSKNDASEIKLTAKRGTYDYISMSKDGNTLTFIEQNDCTQPATQQKCYSLKAIDFGKALSEPQVPEELLNCQHSEIRKPIWIDNNNLVFMQRYDKSWRLMKFDVASNTVSAFYETSEDFILNFQHSTLINEFAVLIINSEGNHELVWLNAHGEMLRKHKLQLPDDEPKQLKMHLAFAPNSEQLLIGSGGQLYAVGNDGHAKNLHIPLDQEVGSPTFHPNGKQMLLIKGNYDSDIVKLPLQSAVNQSPVLIAFERTIAMENLGKYHPSNNRIAYVSKQTGIPQVWLSDEQDKEVISDLPKGSYVQNMVWSANGSEIMLLANMELQKLSLLNGAQPIDFPYPVLNLFHWDPQNNTVLVNVFIGNTVRLITANIITFDYEIVTQKRVYSAVVTEQKDIYFMDSDFLFWHYNPLEDVMLSTLEGQGSIKGLVEDNNQLYGINEDNQLWRYDLSTKSLSVLAQLPFGIEYMSDIKEDEILFTQSISEKQEVIELNVNLRPNKNQ